MAKKTAEKPTFIPDGKKRCTWCGTDPLYIKYHDEEWGKVTHDDKVLFEFLTLESAQAGLSWITILRRRDNYKKAFANFEGVLTAGLSLIIAYGPEILNIVKSWINGKETISQTTLSISTLNKALGSNEVTNAAKQFNELKINIGLAKEGTLS